MGVIGDNGLAFGNEGADNMRLIGRVVNMDFLSVNEPLFSAQQSRQVKIGLKQGCNGFFSDASNLIGKKMYFTKGVNFLDGIKGDYSMNEIFVNKLEKLPDGDKPLGLFFGIGAKKINIEDGGIQVDLQWVNSLMSLSGASAMSTKNLDTARDKTVSPWSFNKWVASSLALWEALTMSTSLNLFACSFVSFMASTPYKFLMLNYHTKLIMSKKERLPYFVVRISSFVDRRSFKVEKAEG